MSHLGIVVCQALADRIIQKAYEMIFARMFEEVQKIHPTFQVGVSLQDIVADWSDIQRSALGTVLGEEVATAVCKRLQGKHFLQHFNMGTRTRIT